MAYKWNFSRVGGITRVRIATGEDIAHLGELDQKMWTITSCPTKGLEIDEQSLKYMDTNADGVIHIGEVVAVANWLVQILNDKELIVKGTDTLPLSVINQDCEEGKKLYDAACTVLQQLGKADAQEISLADSASCLAAVLKSKYEAAVAAIDKNAALEAPFGDQTDAVEAAYKALDAKVKDFFMRAQLAKYAQEGTAALDVQVAQIEAISAENLTAKMEEIAAYPIARIDGSNIIPFDADINPAWTAQWNVIKAACKGEKAVTEELWSKLGNSIQAYRDYQKSIDIKETDIKLDEETITVQMVDKLLHLTRDFYTLLKNYVTLQDFYCPDTKAIFQAGTLLIDQRTCDLCVRVADAGAVAAQAPKSGMYLITCACSSKVYNESFSITAAMTVGDVDDLFVGKNCIFYDRKGRDFDAKVTAIIENPISIRQAMWTPYKKMAKLIEDNINKFAAEKENEVSASTTSAINEKTDSVKADLAKTPEEAKKEAAPTTGFDIAKYAGIFAAVGMAVGMIGSALVAVGKGLMGLTWWQFPLVILAILLLISGPSMFIAWSKLRKRNLAPLLNANGWAVNAQAKVNIPFGETLTQQAKYPKVVASDPFAEKNTTARVISWLVVLAVIAGILWYVQHNGIYNFRELINF
ncbi:MAG: hypothetical protein Q4B58_00130 [Bacteroidales bacterium]|nr:hypothetical protein [Bacteroidales bacterium]